MAKLSEVEEMLEKAEADEEKEKIITGHKNKKEDEAKSKFCDNVVDTIKKKFDIHSPSRVFAEIGEMNADQV